MKYIKMGESTSVTPKKGADRVQCMISELPSVSSHNPWYSLKLKTPPPIFLGRFAEERMKMYENNGSFYARDNFAYLTPNNHTHVHAVLAYLSSSWFSLYLEKNGHAAGGGALQFLTGDYKRSPVPDFTKISKHDMARMTKAWLAYRDDFDRKRLDGVVLDVLGFTEHERIQIITELDLAIRTRTGK